MLGDRRAAHREAVGQVHDRRGMLAELLEDGAPGGIAEGVEHVWSTRVSFHLP
jgi:hypothetical protein